MEEEAGDAVWVFVWPLEVEFGVVAEVLSATSTSVTPFVGCGLVRYLMSMPVVEGVIVVLVLVDCGSFPYFYLEPQSVQLVPVVFGRVRGGN